MYNIINLQNMTLKIPIARKNSILDVGKVSLIQLCFTYTFDKKITTTYWLRTDSGIYDKFLAVNYFRKKFNHRCV